VGVVKLHAAKLAPNPLRVRIFLAEQGSLPKFVVREVEEYLRCGILEYGKTVTYYVQPSKYAGAGDHHASAPSVA
jgi:hypothetical protein